MIIRVERCTVVTAKIAHEIGVFFKNQGFDSRSSQQVTQHHVGGATPGDTAVNLQSFGHGPFHECNPVFAAALSC